MFSFFRGPEVHPEAKSMEQFYTDLGNIVTEVRNAFPNADADSGFKQAAKVISELVELCSGMEEKSALEANEINSQRKEIEPNMGEGGVINVTGDASRLLAQKYNALLKAAIKKEYWPVESCPAVPILGTSLLTVYADTFENRCKKYRNIIEEANTRITSYDRAHQLKPAI